jgi:hypothetical protein
MKDAEDEAFDELAKRQGMWGGGYQAKRQMAADKLQEDLTNYGTAWSQDGKRIDPMSVYKEPVTERKALKLALEALENITNAIYVNSEQEATALENAICAITVIKAALAQPAQEPVARVTGVYGGRFTYEPINPAMVLPTGMALYATPQHTATWVGLTDEDCIGMSAGDKVVAMWANRILKEKNT